MKNHSIREAASVPDRQSERRRGRAIDLISTNNRPHIGPDIGPAVGEDVTELKRAIDADYLFDCRPV